jgi:hypothetical protein
MALRIRLGGFALLALLAASAYAQSTGPLQFVPRARLASAGTARFGTSISLAGDDLLIDSGLGTSIAPRQCVFHRSAGAWSPQATFDVDTMGGPFCMAVSTPLSIEGDVLAIGSGFHPYPFGRAWISRRTGSTWGTPTYVEDPAQFFYFYGQAVLLHGGVLLVGAPNDYFPGEVQQYVDSGSGFVPRAAFGSLRDHFGAALVASGDTLAVADADRVEIHTRSSSILRWNFQADLVPPGAATVRAVALDGDTAVVSTLFPGCAADSTFGVYVYERTGTSWAQTATLTSGDATATEFGRAVAVNGDAIYVGAATAATNHAGTVDVFRRLGSAWVPAARLAPNPALPADAYFGDGLALDGGTLCVGAPGVATNPGEVQVFEVVQLPPPQSYCTAKLNSLGCLPAARTSGLPSATGPDPFLVRASQVINNKTGSLVYTTAGAASTPYQGGTLCVAQPLHRLPPQNSGGNPPPNDCSGLYSTDFNARIRSGVDPALQPGVQVWAQWITRDPADPFHVGLTDAVTFVIGS